MDLTPQLYDLIGRFETRAVQVTCEIVFESVPKIMDRAAIGKAEDPSAAVKRLLLQWILNPETGRYLEEAFFRYTGEQPELAADASMAVQWIGLVARVNLRGGCRL